MITADTITDEQIRELRAELREEQEQRIGDIHTCTVALVGGFNIDETTRARARCAEILNARAKEGK